MTSIERTAYPQFRRLTTARVQQVLHQMRGLPAGGFDLLVQVLVRICEDPYDRLFSRAMRASDPTRRMAELGDFGFAEHLVDDAAGLVRVVILVWTG